ncbi:gliding motility lipoprotein GldD [Sediminitomix flava]|uniref:Protein involved in gliding motility GldD n=1 Tax=Sediminitomix flava TaxID=379075 RepID=A0A315Z161_SEDFL|nr:gliding motility lipoprotein GldD [Sediminitomix flava]PWJ36045.1 protein involved in gliding motility GldD [Sediminitomix flava]
MNKFFSGIGIVFLVFIWACGGEEQVFLPKPKGYHRIEFPKHTFQEFPKEFGNFPYAFRFSDQAEMKPDTSKMSEPYWAEIYYPQYNATIDISYKPIYNSLDSLAGYFNTSLKLTHKHSIRATKIEEYKSYGENGDIIMEFELEGQVPSQYQFFRTDSAQHFLRAALYFPTSTANDSLAPVINYIREDMQEMLKTVTWKD